MLMKLDISDRFRGFPDPAIASLSVLLNIDSLTQIRHLQLKYGCTCGECLEGLMSPRMKLALLAQAEITHDILGLDIGDGPLWCDMHKSGINHVTPHVQQRFRTNKSIRRGFTNAFDLIATCLLSDAIPKKENLLRKFQAMSEWPPVTRSYLQARGTFESALMAVFEKAENEDSKAGDGRFEEMTGEEVSKLKSCRNDHEFGFVSWACGLPRRDYF